MGLATRILKPVAPIVAPVSPLAPRAPAVPVPVATMITGPATPATNQPWTPCPCPICGCCIYWVDVYRYQTPHTPHCQECEGEIPRTTPIMIAMRVVVTDEFAEGENANGETKHGWHEFTRPPFPGMSHEEIRRTVDAMSNHPGRFANGRLSDCDRSKWPRKHLLLQDKRTYMPVAYGQRGDELIDYSWAQWQHGD